MKDKIKLSLVLTLVIIMGVACSNTAKPHSNEVVTQMFTPEDVSYSPWDNKS